MMQEEVDSGISFLVEDGKVMIISDEVKFKII